jgi:outer membrane protein, heavy metal efflux system
MRRLRLVLGLMLVQGGCHSYQDQTDPVVQGLAAQIRDIEPVTAVEQAPPPRPANEQARQPAGERSNLVAWDETPLPVAQIKEKAPKREMEVPPELPGARLPPIRLPKEEKAREQELRRIYPPLAPLPPDLPLVPGPEGRPLALADLQRLATANNPSIKNAVAAIEAAKGAATQAGAYPNPSLFWEADTVGTGPAGYQGGGIDQPIKGWNKLKLQQAAALMDVRNAGVALRRAQSDLAYQVRSNYFAVLVALENVKISRALARFTDQLYRTQLGLVSAGEAASYEPMQLRPTVLQARFNLLQAMNQYHASWKQLAAALGMPDLPPTELLGRVDLPIPVFDYDRVLAQVLAQHTDVIAAQNSILKARYQLELAKVTPLPDFDIHVLFQKDTTTPQRDFVYSAALSFPVPIWDQNLGGIKQANYQLVQATLQTETARLQLTNNLADAFNRYVTNRDQVQMARQQLEDQVRIMPMLYNRYQTTVGEVVFGDLVTAVQTLTTYASTYVTALGLQWTAIVDVANLLQTGNLFQVGLNEEVFPVPDLEEMLRPCWPRPGPAGCPAAVEASGAVSKMDAGFATNGAGTPSQGTPVSLPDPNTGNRNR